MTVLATATPNNANRGNTMKITIELETLTVTPDELLTLRATLSALADMPATTPEPAPKAKPGPKPKAAPEPEDEDEDEPAPKAKPGPKPKAKPAPEPEPEDEEDDDLIGGDDEDEDEDEVTLEKAVALATKMVSNGKSAAVKTALAEVGAKRVSEVSKAKLPAFVKALG